MLLFSLLYSSARQLVKKNGKAREPTRALQLGDVIFIFGPGEGCARGQIVTFLYRAK